MRCSLTSRHCAYLEATWAANDIQQAVDQNWSYQSTEELTIRTMQIAQIVRIARLNSLTNRIVLPMARLLWVFWRIRMCIFRARVRHTGPTDFLAWWIGHFRVETSTFNKMRKFAGLLKPVVCTIKQVGLQVLFFLNNKTNKRINIKPEIALFKQTVNYKWSWENIQCVKDFPAVLSALYKKGGAILF